MEEPGRNIVSELKFAGPNVCDFLLQNSSDAEANALRTWLYTKIPTFAFESVTMHRNNTNLRDEAIAHKIMMLPIDSTRLPIETFDFKLNRFDSEQCVMLKYNLNVCCDGGSDLASFAPVVSDDFIPAIPEGCAPGWEAPRICPLVHLLTLDCGQSISLTATATVGFGSSHAKWFPVFAVAAKPLDHFVVDTKEVLQTYAPVMTSPTAFKFHVESTGAHNLETLLRVAFRQMQMSFA